MLLIETYIGASQIDGLGLYTKKPIEKGTLVAYFEPDFDVLIAAPDSFHELQQKFLKRNAFFSHGKYFLFSDDGRYINHSKQNNLTYASSIVCKIGTFNRCFIALKDSPSGNELTIDYETFSPEQFAELNGFVEMRNANLWPPKVVVNGKYNQG